MKELARTLEQLQAIVDRGGRGLLVTIVSTRGSTYRRAGARAVIEEGGHAFGAISGGCLERDLAERATAWLTQLQPRTITYDSTRGDDLVFGLGLGCKGEVELLVQPFDAAHPPPLLAFEEVSRSREEVRLLTIVAAPSIDQLGRHFRLDSLDSLRDVDSGDALIAWLGEHASSSTKRGSRLQFESESGTWDFLVEVIRPPRSLLLFGGGADIEPVVTQARLLDWDVTVIATREVTTAARSLVAHPEQLEGLLNLDEHDAAVIMTHNYMHDLALLERLLRSPIAYVGLLGPRARANDLLATIAAEGRLDPNAAARLHSPIGLDLGGETPEEIALSIVAEIQATLHDRGGAPLRERESAIHAD
jgi:xanthine/CO dehydrogenase XdhC/CoxF family maturation factor